MLFTQVELKRSSLNVHNKMVCGFYVVLRNALSQKYLLEKIEGGGGRYIHTICCNGGMSGSGHHALCAIAHLLGIFELFSFGSSYRRCALNLRFDVGQGASFGNSNFVENHRCLVLLTVRLGE